MNSSSLRSPLAKLLLKSGAILRTARIGSLAIVLARTASTTAQVPDPVPDVAPVAAGVARFGPQVLISARFVEVTPARSDAESLFAFAGLAAKAPAKALRNVRILNDAQYQAALKTLAGKKGAEVLSAPSMVTRSNQRAVIKIIREFRYATAWEKGEARGTWKPTAYETRNSGVTLEAEPEVRGDATIALQLTPQIVELLGFTDLDSGKSVSAKVAGPNVIAQEIRIPDSLDGHRVSPVFSARKIDARVMLESGSTVVFAGLPETEKVKPFASKAAAHQLLAFITASLAGPDGKPIPAAK